MGYDVYGLSPKVNKIYPERYNEILNEYGKDGWLDWKKEIPQEVKDEYFELKDQYQTDNPGEYFRNNVWFWRPLWSFVCQHCSDFISLKDADGGSFNDGRVISKTKANKIGKRLSELLADGTVDRNCREYELAKAKADVHNKTVEEKLEELKKTVKQETGKKDIVPNDYPTSYKEQWDEIYATKSWDSDYPFSRENVECFATFCLQSGGFEIC